ncbi:ATP-binding protein [Halogeometricum borinquense]|uniref:ATP-binding protein n=1 Tax=Halogeometricum borinquense TaxID=60847 RepID=A0A6C0UI31_9EURY|nr:ATP-binding protein [Halogeometricum borinquense]QIB75224.1 ATP-binding protein [Halogeometricum borinquense]
MSTNTWNIEELKQQLYNEELHALREAGLLQESTIDYLERYRQTYEPGQGVHYQTGDPAVNYYDSEQYVNIVRRDISKMLSRAVQQGNLSVVAHAVGLTNKEDSDLPFQQLLQLENLIHGDRFKIPIFTGGQGGGKSYFAYLLAKYKARLCERDGEAYSVVTNSLTAVQENDDIDELVDSPQKLWDYRLANQGTIVFVFDEASSFLDSKAAGNASDLATFVPFLRRLRKMGILPIIVSHRAMDIGTDIRNLDSVVFIDKPDRKTAVFYDSYEAQQAEEALFEITGFSSEDRYEYDTDDLFISWKWDGLEDVVDQFKNPEKLRNVWEKWGIIRELKEKRDKIEELEQLKTERKELAQEAWELDEYDKKEIAEFAGVSPQTVASWNLHKEI